MKARLAYEFMVAQLGVSEQPPGSNDGPKIRAWLANAGVPEPEPWCAALEFSAFLHAGVQLPIQYPAAVGSWVDAAKANGWRVYRPLRYDVVSYSWHGNSPHPSDHIGTVERVLALPWPRNRYRYWIRTVEGNTGNAVRRRWRWVDPRSVCFIRVPDR